MPQEPSHVTIKKYPTSRLALESYVSAQEARGLSVNHVVKNKNSNNQVNKGTCNSFSAKYNNNTFEINENTFKFPICSANLCSNDCSHPQEQEK